MFLPIIVAIIVTVDVIEWVGDENMNSAKVRVISLDNRVSPIGYI